ncbi:hypothetical protein [Herpetosiphon giganteus]|uniref:hypothetical protein n=1 Tax=Herpetosiphon giganteus TaxID=2029754 RepID=UPI00195A1422|nr:hypothetical protein [Herpetosiphon giganteus]MBM7842070.1 hypothetical protein [Herpetosiphon giganteus]
MRLMYGLVLGLILVGCQSTAPNNNYNQDLDAKIKELYGNRLNNYLIFDVVYKSEFGDTEVQIIDLERKQLNYLQFNQDSHDISEIKAIGNDQIVEYTDCNRMLDKLNIRPEAAIDLVVKANPEFANQPTLALYKPHIGIGNCHNLWQVSTRDGLIMVDAETGELSKPAGW